MMTRTSFLVVPGREDSAGSGRVARRFAFFGSLAFCLGACSSTQPGGADASVQPIDAHAHADAQPADAADAGVADVCTGAGCSATCASPQFCTATLVTAGGNSTCAVTSARGAACWGQNHKGQLGDGTLVNRSSPVAASVLTGQVLSISTRGGHTCAALSTGDVKCWGENGSGQLGNGKTDNSTAAVSVQTPQKFTVVSMGFDHSCARTSTGGVSCWGAGDFGQLGNGDELGSTTPTWVRNLGGAAESLSSGSLHNCAVVEPGAVKCWGDNEFGQLGNGEDMTYEASPVDVVGISNAWFVAAGNNHTCAVIRVTGDVKCWGNNASGQLGDGTKQDRSTPVDVVGISGAVYVAAGNGHTCATMAMGGVKCWGGNGAGQLGDGSTAERLAPVSVVGLSTASVSRIAASGAHSCAVTAARGVVCWGENQLGQLGDTTNVNRTTPVDVRAP